eukprot:3936192-Rhodomonas_salina.3
MDLMTELRRDSYEGKDGRKAVEDLKEGTFSRQKLVVTCSSRGLDQSGKHRCDGFERSQQLFWRTTTPYACESATPSAQCSICDGMTNFCADGSATSKVSQS